MYIYLKFYHINIEIYFRILILQNNYSFSLFLIIYISYTYGLYMNCIIHKLYNRIYNHIKHYCIINYYTYHWST